MNATKKSTWAIFLSLCLVLAGTTKAFAHTDPSISQQPPQAAQQSAEQLQQLVAPIALYPDSLVAQILTAATYPQRVVAAEKFMQNQKSLTGDSLAREVDKQSWDPSVSAHVSILRSDDLRCHQRWCHIQKGSRREQCLHRRLDDDIS